MAARRKCGRENNHRGGRALGLGGIFRASISSPALIGRATRLENGNEIGVKTEIWHADVICNRNIALSLAQLHEL